MSTIPELQTRIGEVNAANGWTMGARLRARHIELGMRYEPHDSVRRDHDQRVVDHQIAVLALITTEVAEAIEEIRNGRSVDETYYAFDDGEGPDAPAVHPDGSPRKPEGVPSELADVVIRALDFAETWGINLEAAIEEKLAYNATRGNRHGGKKL